MDRKLSELAPRNTESFEKESKSRHTIMVIMCKGICPLCSLSKRDAVLRDSSAHEVYHASIEGLSVRLVMCTEGTRSLPSLSVVSTGQSVWYSPQESAGVQTNFRT